MNKYILKSSLKTNYKFLSILLCCIIFTIVCVVALFPIVQENNFYGELLNSMPESMLDAFGMNGDMSNLNDFLNVNFYNSFYLYIIMVFSIVFSSKLITKHIESTSLVYYLNSKVSRSEFLCSQIAVYILGLFSIYVSSILSGILGKVIFANKYSFDYGKFIAINTMIICVFLFLSSICILISSISSTVSEAITWSTLVIGGEYIINMIANISSDFDFLNNFSVFILCQKDKILYNNTNFIISLVMLIILSVILLMASKIVFKKRDLNL